METSPEKLSQKRAQLLQSGVQMLDPSTVYVEPSVTVGAGTLLLPNTILRGNTTIGENCEIGPSTMITDCTLGHRVVVNASQCIGSTIEDEANIGPFAFVRPESTIGKRVRVGNFVEVKNSTIGEDTKMSHLIYVGDSDVGIDTNFGCGTVTVNFDGNQKHRTTIGDHCFIGCNTNLVAPVTLHNGCYTAAGSTITSDVPQDGLAVARTRQKVFADWAKKHREKSQ